MKKTHTHHHGDLLHALSIAFLLLGGVMMGCGCLGPSPHGLSLPAIAVSPDFGGWNPAPSLRTEDTIAWFAGHDLGVEGRGWDDTEHFWNRLPARAKEVVPPMVWTLSQQTAGMAVRFASDSPELNVIWSGGGAMNHMAASGVSGLDLYRRHPDGQWVFAAVGRPNPEVTRVQLLPRPGGPWAPDPNELTEYLLFLPLYSELTLLELGFREGSRVLVPTEAHRRGAPIVFYGTSITQGGCASRTGMAHPAILSRWLDREVINLGFSGSGKSEPELAHLLAELDPALYIIDALPNMEDDMVLTRTAPFVRILREARPGTPILLVEDARPIDRNRILRAVADELLAEGIPHLYYLEGDNLINTREEGTVDGVHPTDLGFLQMAETFYPKIVEVLGRY